MQISVCQKLEKLKSKRKKIGKNWENNCQKINYQSTVVTPRQNNVVESNHDQ